jgi:hypothetical protein
VNGYAERASLLVQEAIVAERLAILGRIRPVVDAAILSCSVDQAVSMAELGAKITNAIAGIGGAERIPS